MVTYTDGETKILERKWLFYIMSFTYNHLKGYEIISVHMKICLFFRKMDGFILSFVYFFTIKTGLNRDCKKLLQDLKFI